MKPEKDFQAMNGVLELTHANTGAKVFFNRPLVFYFYFSAAHSCVHIVSNGGAFCPVKESVEDITKMLETQNGPEAQGVVAND